MAAAKALRSFVAGDGSDDDWAGALLVADCMHNIGILAQAFTKKR